MSSVGGVVSGVMYESSAVTDGMRYWSEIISDGDMWSVC